MQLSWSTIPDCAKRSLRANEPGPLEWHELLALGLGCPRAGRCATRSAAPPGATSGAAGSRGGAGELRGAAGRSFAPRTNKKG